MWGDWIGRIKRGTVKPNQQVTVIGNDGKTRNAKILQVLGFMGLERVEVLKRVVILCVLPVCPIYISDTLCDP